MNQEQKGTIREEFIRDFTVDGQGENMLDYILPSTIYDFIDQVQEEAYQSGAKDKVEEVRKGIAKYVNKKFIEGVILDPLELYNTLKDNT